MRLSTLLVFSIIGMAGAGAALAQDLPPSLERIIAEHRDTPNSPASGSPGQLEIWRQTYEGKTVYYLPFARTHCCDMMSMLYDAEGELICMPDGGITGVGDGRCPSFRASAAGELVYGGSRGTRDELFAALQSGREAAAATTNDAAAPAVPQSVPARVLVPIAAVIALALLAILSDYRFMTALKSAQPELYRQYGGHSFFPAPPRGRMMSAVLTGRYKAEVTDPRARAVAAQFRAAMLLFFAGLLTGLVYAAISTAG